MERIKIDNLEYCHLKDVVDLHKAGINYGFGTYLGGGFLKYLYKNVIYSDSGIGYVALYDDKVVGFIASTVNLKVFYKRFLFRYSVMAGLLSIHKILRLKSLKSIMQNVFYPAKKQEIELPNAEIISIAISSKMRGKGIGRMLIDKTMSELRSRNINEIKVLVGDRLNANDFYKRLGFQFVCHETYNSDKMNANVYIKKMDRD